MQWHWLHTHLPKSGGSRFRRPPLGSQWAYLLLDPSSGPGFSFQFPRVPPWSAYCKIYSMASVLQGGNCFLSLHFQPDEPAALSNSFTCCLAASVTREPLIMRTSSSTLASPVSDSTRVIDR